MRIERIPRETGRFFVFGLAGCLLGCGSEGPSVTVTKAEAAKTKEETRALHQELKAERKGGMKKKAATVASEETKPSPEAAKPASDAPEK